MKKFLSVLLTEMLLSVSILAFGCAGPEPPLETEVVIAEKGKESDFSVIVNISKEYGFATQINEALEYYLGVSLKYEAKNTKNKNRIVIDASETKNKELIKGLKDNEYRIKLDETDGYKDVLVAYKGAYARTCAIDRLITDYIVNEKFSVPKGLDVSGTCSKEDVIIESDIQGLRDPFVFYENGAFYCYGTGWHCYKNTTGNLKSGWVDKGLCVNVPSTFVQNTWAPEVYKYNGYYYMITTYLSNKPGQNVYRGCSVFRATSPEGPFTEISDGHITPADWSCIDGTLYIDDNGTPFMAFCHEWVSTSDGVGTMAVAELTKDLLTMKTPVEIFRADDPKWQGGVITDGCYFYKTAEGNLLMIWSNVDKTGGYSVGIAKGGKTPASEWTQLDRALFLEEYTNEYDGGHGMIFTHNGQMYLSIHTPNTGVSKPTFIKIKEAYGTLVWDAYKK